MYRKEKGNDFSETVRHPTTIFARGKSLTVLQCEARYTVYNKIYSAKKDLHTNEYKDFKSLNSVVCKFYFAL